jgi:hypothetical protein
MHPRLLAASPSALLLCLAFTANAAHAGTDAPVPSIEVSALKDPEMRSYRSIVAGLDAFDHDHALAPTATLRFHMMRHAGGSVDASDGLVLSLVSDASTIPVPIGPDGLFTIQRDQAAIDADATFMLNRRSGAYTAHPEVRTPGLPDNVRRLGDLRLECRVTIAIVKDQMPFLAKVAVNSLLMSSDWCAKKAMNFGYPSALRVSAATLHDGTRTLPLPVEDWRYSVPIGDPSWSNDATVELSFAGTAPAVPTPAAPASAPSPR